MKKNGFLESIRVTSPCEQDWDAMSGGEKVRFCEHCALEVNNLSALRRKEAMRLVKESAGRICVRYVKNPETGAPVFAEKLYQITRRAGRAAAGVLSASLTLSTLAYAQGGATAPLLPEQTSIKNSGKKQSGTDQTESQTGTISGAARDPIGVVIPNAPVKLVNEKTGETRSTTTDENGYYEFKNLAPETYKIIAEAYAGFTAYEAHGVLVSENAGTTVDLQRTAADNYRLMGVIAAVEYEQPLLGVVADENFEAVKDLIAKGANVNAKDKNYGGATALHVAVDMGNAEIAGYLLDMGAKINARDKERRTPLMLLDSDPSPELVRMLLDHGARINAFDVGGNTPLMFAAQYENAEVLRVLLDAGANLNAQNKEGKTALMLAAENDCYANVEVLLEAGANVALRDRDGDTALDLTDDEKIRSLLKSYNAGK